MSIQFNDTTAYKGLVQFYEKECGFERGDISGNSDALKEFTAEVNAAMDDFWAMFLPASGGWRLDDINQTIEMQVLVNIVSGTRGYSFLSDASGNVALEIFKVFVLPSATATQYQEVFPYDPKHQSGIDAFDNGLNAGGVPSFYKKEGMKVYFDLIPDYSVANGVKAIVSREGSYFTSADTTKKPGVPGVFHRYFFLKPAENYARIHDLANHTKILNEITKLEGLARAFLGGRAQERGSEPVLRGEQKQFE